MQKLINVTITTPKKTTFAKEVLDIGGNYYFVEDNELYIVKKDGEATISFDKRIEDNDNSDYLNKKEVIYAD